MNKIYYYDFARPYWSSFYLNGFLANQKKYNYKLSIKRDIPEPLRSAVMDDDWRHILFSMSLFSVKYDGKDITLCIDAHDMNKADPIVKRGGYHLPILEKVDYYFKMNYNQNSINEDALLKKHATKIFPVTQMLSIRPSLRLTIQSCLFPSEASKWSGVGARIKLREVKNHLSLDAIRGYRKAKKKYDVFFVTSYRYREHHHHHVEERYEILKELTRRSGIRALVGFAATKDLPSEYQRFQMPRYTYRDYIRNLALAKIVIYVRGLHDCLSQKFSLYLAMGLPVIGHRLRNQASLYQHEHLKDQFNFEDPVEIADNVERLLAQPGKLDHLSELNATTFDDYLTPSKTIEDIMRRIL